MNRTLSPEDWRSWRLNDAALTHACCDWASAAPIIRRNLERLARENRVAPAYLDRCRDLFEQGPEAMRAAFLDLTHEGQVLRSIHPFAGLLCPAERNEILRQTRRGAG